MHQAITKSSPENASKQTKHHSHLPTCKHTLSEVRQYQCMLFYQLFIEEMICFYELKGFGIYKLLNRHQKDIYK